VAASQAARRTANRHGALSLECAAAQRRSDDQSPGNQPRQSVAKRRRADFVALRQIDDAEARAGREIAGDDVTLDQARGAFAQCVRTRHIP
jgi:hypothetical protein